MYAGMGIVARRGGCRRGSDQMSGVNGNLYHTKTQVLDLRRP